MEKLCQITSRTLELCKVGVIREEWAVLAEKHQNSEKTRGPLTLRVIGCSAESIKLHNKEGKSMRRCTGKETVEDQQSLLPRMAPFPFPVFLDMAVPK